jgi:NAD(P)-dependent dehydrogenase (short-subunit alcohol dehydrogenase family)
MADKKTAIVTGAGAGVGRCAAITLAKDGYNVVIVGRSEGNTTETEELIKADGGEVTKVIADVGNEEDVKRFVNTAVEKYGKIDAFIHSAARFQPYTKIADTDTELFDDIMRINVKGTFFCMKYVLKQMEKQKSGVIVNVASHDGLQSDAEHGTYSASKHAVLGLTKNAAVEYGPMGIRVCAVCPGSINTKMIKDILDNIDYSVLGPMQRPAEPQEIADVAVYLASDKATFLNGSIVRADGGFGI